MGETPYIDFLCRIDLLEMEPLLSALSAQNYHREGKPYNPSLSQVVMGYQLAWVENQPGQSYEIVLWQDVPVVHHSAWFLLTLPKK